jgi:succinate dehydrogenase / fumarate reductase membrane anchor subunit
MKSVSGRARSELKLICATRPLIAVFHHAALGLQVIAEDYIHSRVRFAVVALVQLACASGGAAGVVATLLIAVTS